MLHAATTVAYYIKRQGCYMAKLNISQAAKLFGVHRSTVQRHIKEGKLSSESQEDGQKLIDMSELVRVYGEPKNPATSATVSHDDAMLQNATPNPTGATPATGVLEQKVEMLEQQLGMVVEDKDYLRKENHRLLEIIEQQTRLLPAPKTEEPVQRPQQAQTEESISSQVVEKPDFVASPTQEGIEIEQDASVDAQEGISQKRKDVSKVKVPQKKKNAPQRQNKIKKKKGFFSGLFGGKK